MKILVHNPRNNKRWEHYAVEVDGKWRALCSQYLQENNGTANGKWVLVEKTDQHEPCGNCRKIHSKKIPPSRPALPCTKPEKLITLWTRENDDWALVHTCAPGDAKQSRCGIKNPEYAPDRWIKTHAQPAKLVTCSLCLKAEGLYLGHPPYKHKKKSNSSQVWLNAWYANQGCYHHSDPRAG